MDLEKNNQGKFRRGFSKEQLRGKHHITLTPELNEAFLRECDAERRIPADLIRIILEDRYSRNKVRSPYSVDVQPRGGAAQKRDIA